EPSGYCSGLARLERDLCSRNSPGERPQHGPRSQRRRPSNSWTSLPRLRQRNRLLSGHNPKGRTITSPTKPCLLFCSSHCYLDPSSGAALSTRDLLELLTRLELRRLLRAATRLRRRPRPRNLAPTARPPLPGAPRRIPSCA